MKNKITIVLLLLVAVACQKPQETAENESEKAVVEEPEMRKMYIDVHDLGPGNVTAAAVADAHKKDLELQDSLDVSFVKYWVDEMHGKVYCLSQAHDPSDVIGIHTNAHGLVPGQVMLVEDGEVAEMVGTKKLFLDVHELGPGNVDAAGVAEAHEKDLAVQGEYDVNFINYWVDEASGTVVCLSEASDSLSVVQTHSAAHGLIPVSVSEVTQGE